MTILERFLSGDVRALARVISFVENREEGYQKLLADLYDRSGSSWRLGITGPPGAGKSTLVDVIARSFIKDNNKVGVIAVDPTSPFTGGALLGDRVRLTDIPSDGSFFFRSMATRGASGGLAGATDNVAIVLNAFGFDIIIIETVGVGQVELDIIDSCDIVVVVLVPESGDSVQTMKAGLTEIADIFCINKADRPGADRIESDLMLTLDTRKSSPETVRPPIIQTVATQSEGTDTLLEAIRKTIDQSQKSGRFEIRRRKRLKKKVLNILKHRFEKQFLERLAGKEEFREIIDEIADGGTNPFSVGDELYARFVGQ